MKVRYRISLTVSGDFEVDITPEELVAYTTGKLSDDDRDRIADALWTACPGFTDWDTDISEESYEEARPSLLDRFRKEDDTDVPF